MISAEVNYNALDEMKFNTNIFCFKFFFIVWDTQNK